jgi:hypothetical protein
MTRRSTAVLLAILGIGGYVAWLNLPLWRDTYFHVEGGGLVEFPSGHTVPANRWINLPVEMPKFALLQIGNGRSREHHLVQNMDDARVAAIVSNGQHQRAIVTRFRGQVPSGVVEYWLRPDTP